MTEEMVFRKVLGIVFDLLFSTSRCRLEGCLPGFFMTEPIIPRGTGIR